MKTYSLVWPIALQETPPPGSKLRCPIHFTPGATLRPPPKPALSRKDIFPPSTHRLPKTIPPRQTW